MANVKISQLPAATEITSDDLAPIVENTAGQTQKATFQQVLNYVTSSTFADLEVTEMTASDLYVGGDVEVGGTIRGDIKVSTNITDASYTLTADDYGKVLLFNSSAMQDITCSSGLDAGFNVTAVQLGIGQLNFSGSGVTLVNRFAHTSSAGQFSSVSVIVLNGTQYLIVGDTA